MIRALLLFLVLPMAAQAQQLEITPETPVNPATIRQWLHGMDPRLIAWAADFARRTHDHEALAEMAGLLVHWQSEPIAQEAESAVLDALIEEQTPVAAEAIQSTADQFAPQAAILAGRLPVAESRAVLHGWSHGTIGRWYAPALARTATMMLARNPDPAFVANLLAETQEALQINLVAPDGGFLGAGTGMGTACGDSFATPVPAGWPVTYTYDLVENDPSQGIPVVALDNDRITARRFETHRPIGSCMGVEPLSRETRHRIIAYWLGVPPKAMDWQPTESATIVWSDRPSYERERGTIIAQHAKTLRATVTRLVGRGLLKSVDNAHEPKLIVTLLCAPDPCPLKDLSTQ